MGLIGAGRGVSGRRQSQKNGPPTPTIRVSDGDCVPLVNPSVCVSREPCGSGYSPSLHYAFGMEVWVSDPSVLSTRRPTQEVDASSFDMGVRSGVRTGPRHPSGVHPRSRPRSPRIRSLVEREPESSRHSSPPFGIPTERLTERLDRSQPVLLPLRRR